MMQRVLMALSVALAVASVCAARAGATFYGRNGVIAYVNNDHDRSGISEIVEVGSDGRHRRVIHRSVTGDDTGFGVYGLDFSPRGDKLAYSDFASGGLSADGYEAVYVAGSGGRGPRQVTPPGLNALYPLFSPDARNLAFETSSGSTLGLDTVAAGGSGLRQITHGTDAAFPAAWLPSGRIAFFNQVPRLFTIGATGSGLRRVTVTNASDFSFSPRGRSLVFVRGFHLWIAHSDGSHAHRITSGRLGDVNPTFSPDGKWIAFERQSGVDGEGGGHELWMVDIHGHRAHRVVREPAAPGGGYTDQVEGVPAWQALP
jgi:Tol biopolymer transport system component